jgi:hypothetical protein
MTRTRRAAGSPLLASSAALAALTVALVATAVPRLGDDAGPPLRGTFLSEGDRSALDAPAVLRGAPAPADPAVDLADPEQVARAYLAAAHAMAADDAGRTQLRAAGYAVPGSTPAAVGVLVLDAPQPGTARSAAVTGLHLVAADDADQRRGYRATLTTTEGPPDGPAVVAELTSYVVLARQPDGNWLVSAESPELLPREER